MSVGCDNRNGRLDVSREHLVYFLNFYVDCHCCSVGKLFGNLCACRQTKEISKQTVQRVYSESCNCRFSHCHISDRQVGFFNSVVFVLNKKEILIPLNCDPAKQCLVLNGTCSAYCMVINCEGNNSEEGSISMDEISLKRQSFREKCQKC